MQDVYVTGRRDGIWVVQAGQRIGPLTDFGAVLDALGPPTAHTEDLADMAYTLLQPDIDTVRLPAAVDENPRTRARHRLVQWSAALGFTDEAFPVDYVDAIVRDDDPPEA